MRRRAFLVGWLCLAAIGSEAGARGATDLPRVAVLSPDPPTAADPTTGNPLAMFLEALRERGYVDGRNIRLDFRFAENRLDRLPALAAELVKARPAVIYTHTTAGAFAAAGATTSIPIVVGPAGEQTMEQLAGNFAKPVANVTGFSGNAGNQEEKCLQLLKEAAPDLSRIGVLLNPDNRIWRDILIALNAAAEQLGLALIRIESRGSVDIDRTLGHYTHGTVDGCYSLAIQRSPETRAFASALSNSPASSICRAPVLTLLMRKTAVCSRSEPIWVRSSGARRNMCTGSCRVRGRASCRSSAR